MKIIVVGAGQLGQLLIRFVVEENHDITIIDTAKELVEELTDRYEINGVVGNGAAPSTLEKAGAHAARLLVAVSGSDELNLLCSHLARKLGVPHIIARVRSQEFLPESEALARNLGINLIVNPEYETAVSIVRELKYPSLLKVAPFGGGVVNLIELVVEQGSKLVNLELKYLGHHLKARVLVSAAIRNGEALIPRGNFKIAAGDRLFIVANNQNLSLLLEELGLNKKPIQKVLIIGGGLIGYYLAKQLGADKVKTKIIDKDTRRCRELSELLPESHVVSCNVMEVEALLAEGIKDYRAVAALTGDDEVNLVTSIFASSVGVEKILAQISTISYANMLSAAKNSQTISPHYVSADLILRYTKDISNSTQDIKKLSQIADGGALVIEFDLNSTFPQKDVPLKDLKLKENVLVAALVRGGHNIHPNGLTVLKEGDSVIIVTTDRSIITLADILA